MKLLFITYRDVNDKSYGGSQCTNRNYLSFCKLFGSDNVEVLDLTVVLTRSLSHKIAKRVNYLFGFQPGLSHKTIRLIIKLATGKDYVFIDSSSYGIIAYYLKKEKFKGKIICFFHNVEYYIALQKTKLNPFNFWQLIINYINEKNAIRYSDKIVALNKRDRNELNRLFGEKNISIIPISLFDSYKVQEKKLTSMPPTLLFIGNNWYANIHGLKWFIDSVLDSVNVKLQIVGSGMDELKNNFIHPKIEFLGYIPDLSMTITNADYILSPIFIGSGMKVKTCEALMYGKNIIGTREAFEGYEIEYEKVGAICNTKEEFIYTINNYCSIKRVKFNEYSRECYIEKYSFHATLKKFEKLL